MQFHGISVDTGFNFWLAINLEKVENIKMNDVLHPLLFQSVLHTSEY